MPCVMIVVVDSGSTKADWVVVSDNHTEMIHTMGFNPIYHSSDLIRQKVAEGFSENGIDPHPVTHVFYYGTAIWDDNKRKVIEKALGQVFTDAEVEVEHDLLGAARSTCGNSPGISCILGTGSNTCKYDGKDIVDNVTNLGYFIGDEGSGAHLGKALVKAYFYRELPQDLIAPLEELVPGGKEEFLTNIYNKPSPNVYLASLTRFIGAHRDHFFIQRLVADSFSEFIDRHVRKYSGHLSLPIHFIGSIAYHFKDFLTTLLEERGMQSGNFIKKPVDTLVDYHRTHPTK